LKLLKKILNDNKKLLKLILKKIKKIIFEKFIKKIPKKIINEK